VSNGWPCDRPMQRCVCCVEALATDADRRLHARRNEHAEAVSVCWRGRGAVGCLVGAGEDGRLGGRNAKASHCSAAHKAAGTGPPRSAVAVCLPQRARTGSPSAGRGGFRTKSVRSIGSHHRRTTASQPSPGLPRLPSPQTTSVFCRERCDGAIPVGMCAVPVAVPRARQLPDDNRSPPPPCTVFARCTFTPARVCVSQKSSRGGPSFAEGGSQAVHVQGGRALCASAQAPRSPRYAPTLLCPALRVVVVLSHVGLDLLQGFRPSRTRMWRTTLRWQAWWTASQHPTASPR
jgi:hypothetical protein